MSDRLHLLGWPPPVEGWGHDPGPGDGARPIGSAGGEPAGRPAGRAPDDGGGGGSAEAAIGRRRRPDTRDYVDDTNENVEVEGMDTKMNKNIHSTFGTAGACDANVVNGANCAESAKSFESRKMSQNGQSILTHRAANGRPVRPLSPRARIVSDAVAQANRAASQAANRVEAENARERELFMGVGVGAPEAPGGDKRPVPLSGAAQRVRRREAARQFGSKTLAVLMAVILAVGLMPLPAFGDEGAMVVNGQRVVAASSQSLTTVDANGNVTTETNETTVSEDGTVKVNG